MSKPATTPECVLCSGSTRRWCTEPRLLVECETCGFIFQAIPPADPLGNYRRRGYDRIRRAHGGPAAFARFHHDLRVARNRVQSVRPLAPSKGVWLDVGAGNGAMLAAADEAGYEAVGVELHPETAGELQAVLGRRVLSMAEAITDWLRPIAVLSFYDVLEHLVEPRGVLRRLCEDLAVGGVLAIEVPDAGSARARNLRGRWKHVKPDEHLGYFTEVSLRALVARCGCFQRAHRVSRRESIDTEGRSVRVPSDDKLHLIWRKES
jgi:SAM-dependent methyltransferase